MKNAGRFTKYKFIITAAIALFILAVIIANRHSSKSFDEVYEAINAVYDQEELVPAGSGDIISLYGIDPKEYDGAALWTASFGISAEEIFLVKLKDDSRLAEVKAAINDRLEERLDVFQGYAPLQEQLVKEASVVVRLPFVFIAVSENAALYNRTFTSAV